MNYVVFYRTLESNHARWGPQWTHRTHVVYTTPDIAASEDIDQIQVMLQALHPGKRTEIVSMLRLNS